jgi:CBS domain-containing protein
MKVKDMMTENVATATPETGLEQIAKMLVENDCGAIPILKNENSKRPVGIVTDRDIVCRVVAEGRDPATLTAADAMSSPCISVTPGTKLDVCCATMEKGRVRRLLVVDEEGSLCGIISQADVALRIADKAGEIVREVSQPTKAASLVAP